MPNKVLNPKTGRYIMVGTKRYDKLVAEGVIKEEPSENESNNDEAESPDNYNEEELQTTLANLSTDMIRDNLEKVVKKQKLTNKQMDEMLRKMLYEKLCVSSGSNTVQKQKRASKSKKYSRKHKKKGRRPKFIVESEPESSESEPSESSESESD